MELLISIDFLIARPIDDHWFLSLSCFTNKAFLTSFSSRVSSLCLALLSWWIRMERNCCQNIRNCLVRTDRFLQTKKTSNVIPFSVIRIILIVLEVFCLLQFCDCIPRSIFLICFKTLDFLVEVLSGRTIVREIFFWEILIFGSNPSWRSCYEGKKIAGQSKVDPGVVFFNCPWRNTPSWFDAGLWCRASNDAFSHIRLQRPLPIIGSSRKGG